MEKYLGEQIPKLGFGLMRLPKGPDGQIDAAQVKGMVDTFMEAGFRYFDTAYGYDDGNSEKVAKIALVDRYPRDSFYLATKLPAFMAESREAAEQMLYTSLERTGAGYFDFYLLHNLGPGRTEKFDEYGIWDFLAARKKEGLIRHLGFSMHAEAEDLEKVLNAHPEVEFVQLQINYIDWEDAKVQSRACYEVCRKHGKPMVVMEPVKGGSLSMMPEEASAALRKMAPNASNASWALRFVASLDGLITVLSGMSTPEQMADNIRTFKDFKPLTDAERAAIDETVRYLRSVPTIPCTGCNYCTKGCPQKINIPGVFSAVNTYKVYKNMDGARGGYLWGTMGGGKAADCVGCGQCETVCPQSIRIIDELKEASTLLDS